MSAAIADFQSSLWARTAGPGPSLTPLRGDRRVEVVIIGGGLTGLSAALHLSETGRQVLLLEAREIGFGASGRNAAGYAPIHMDRTPLEVETLLGPEAGRRLNRLVAGSGQLLAGLADRCGPIAGRRETGILVTATRPSKMARLREMAGQWAPRGGNVDLLEGTALADATGSNGFGLGLRFREAGTVQPLGLARGLAGLALAAGAEIAVTTPATRLIPDGAGWRVETPLGTVAADRVLIATDAYPATELWPGLSASHYAVPLAMAASDPLPDTARHRPPDGMPIADIDEPVPFWLMREPGGRLVATLLPPAGGSGDVTALARPFTQRLARLYPGLPVPHWRDLWLGTVAMTPSRLPRLIRLSPTLHALGGYSGQGLTTALAAGRDYALTVAAGMEEASHVPVQPLRAAPFSRTIPWLLRHMAFPLVRRLAR